MAAIIHRWEAVTRILLDKVDIEAKNNDGITALWLAVRGKYTEGSNLLLDRGASFRVRDKSCKSIIFDAAAMGIRRILTPLLLEDHEDINSKDENGRTPLWHLCSCQDQDCVNWFLELGPNTNLQSIDGASLFHKAAQEGNVKVLRYLCERKTATTPTDGKDNSLHTPLWLAADFGDKSCVDMLLRQNANADAQNNKKISVLHQAVNKRHLNIVELLLYGPKDDQNKLTAETGAGISETNVMQSQYCPPDINTKDIDGRSPLIKAVIDGSLEIVNLLLRSPERGKLRFDGVDGQGDSELGRAAYGNCLEIVEALLNAGASINLQKKK
ncbi:ankyrin repeat-containing domain protein [Amylocarpus encephaloides]|uniref:Ankyrin repeat-containing domain protein n=1 Tax=Amylocarpus encephaloides TaxID=45428 RepID=A0A9P8CA57_9HELO|nr:ankyrin repeat-containing domain protein [Amylocarpus encephaloides]